MLGGILPQDDQIWFFKLTGPPDQVAALAEPFGVFVTSTNFENSEPRWNVPEGWIVGPEKPFRYRTYLIGPGKLELSISSLPRPADLDSAYLDNINRWRNQLSLPGITAAELAARETPGDDGEIVDSTSPAGKLVLINFVGLMAADAMPPFAGMGEGVPNNAEPRSKLAYAKPGHWEPGDRKTMREAAFLIRGPQGEAEATIITAGGSLRDNVNRWREQVALPPWSEDELKQNVELLQTGRLDIVTVDLSGPKQAILGGIFQHDGKAWFVKLMGPTELVQAERAHFEAFLQSITFE